ncbi:hypothetical protein IFM89_005716 [Coptis chinensis]|uniref:FBD domain-containing protein n=1 Tax=Coptis chinensis TaxID=261450 RepID=A0A835I5X9_9MAGN|nr:hypothetical protein IFM89_005716 [Coptis chinensis]
MPTPFSALRQLKLKMWLSRDCIRGIKYLLEKSYNLETLPVEITTRCCSKRLMYPYCNATNVDTTKIWEYWKTNMVLQCNFYNLRFVEVWNVHGYVNELEFLKLLLKNAIALEKLIIFTCKSYSRDSQRPLRRFSELLLAFPRASSGAAILLL